MKGTLYLIPNSLGAGALALGTGTAAFFVKTW